MNCDCAFRIGSGHTVCEDYAFASVNGYPHIIVSDGCSSSVGTDYGTRILTSAARIALGFSGKVTCSDYFISTISIAMAHRVNLMLPPDVLDCTLMVAAVRPTNLFSSPENKLIPPWIEIAVLGDGLIAIKSKSNEIVVYSIEYNTGYPFYISYLEDLSRKTMWQKRLEENSVSVHIYYRSPYGKWDHYLKKDIYNPVFDIAGFAPCITDDNYQFHFLTPPFAREETEFVALMSDGIRSFSQVTTTETGIKRSPLEITFILEQLLNFKGYEGVFVQRRVNKFLKDMKKQNFEHYDDISLSVMSF